MFSWFTEEDLVNFKPIYRYITGKNLIERWSTRTGLQPEAYIKAKIWESRLQDFHPICGLTKATNSESEFSPPLETGLFTLSDVIEIEEQDFGSDGFESMAPKLDGHLNHDLAMQKRANEIAMELKFSKKRRPRKVEVAKKLAVELGKPLNTVLRRIRLEW